MTAVVGIVSLSSLLSLAAGAQPPTPPAADSIRAAREAARERALAVRVCQHAARDSLPIGHAAAPELDAPPRPVRRLARNRVVLDGFARIAGERVPLIQYSCVVEEGSWRLQSFEAWHVQERAPDAPHRRRRAPSA